MLTIDVRHHIMLLLVVLYQSEADSKFDSGFHKTYALLGKNCEIPETVRFKLKLVLTELRPLWCLLLLLLVVLFQSETDSQFDSGYHMTYALLGKELC